MLNHCLIRISVISYSEMIFGYKNVEVQVFIQLKVIINNSEKYISM